MKEIIIDTLVDSLKLLPFLFVAFFIIELIEHKLDKKNKDLIAKNWSFIRFSSSMRFFCYGN